jgi:hypothetical protein
MESSMTVFIAGWLFLAAVVVALAVTRKVVSYNEDELLHVRDCDAPLSARQEVTAHRLEWIDRWGKILTAASVASGMLLAVLYLYRAFVETSKLPTM